MKRKSLFKIISIFLSASLFLEASVYGLDAGKLRVPLNAHPERIVNAQNLPKESEKAIDNDASRKIQDSTPDKKPHGFIYGFYTWAMGQYLHKKAWLFSTVKNAFKFTVNPRNRKPVAQILGIAVGAIALNWVLTLMPIPHFNPAIPLFMMIGSILSQHVRNRTMPEDNKIKLWQFGLQTLAICIVGVIFGLAFPALYHYESNHLLSTEPFILRLFGRPGFDLTVGNTLSNPLFFFIMGVKDFIESKIKEEDVKFKHVVGGKFREFFIGAQESPVWMPALQKIHPKLGFMRRDAAFRISFLFWYPVMAILLNATGLSDYISFIVAGIYPFWWMYMAKRAAEKPDEVDDRINGPIGAPGMPIRTAI